MINTAVIKRIVYFGLGVGVGIAATNRYYRLKYEDIALEEVESIRAVYDERVHNQETENEVVNQIYEAITEYEQPEDVGISESYLAEEYDELVNDYKTDDIMLDKLYPIDDETFINTPVGYEVITLEYYEGDGILIEDGEVVEDPQAIIGYIDVAKLFLEYEDGAETAYVRNEVLKIDYEVVKVDDSFMEGDAHLNETYDE